MPTRRSTVELASASVPEARLSNVYRALKGHTARVVFTALLAFGQLLSPLSMTSASAAPAPEAPDLASSQIRRRPEGPGTAQSTRKAGATRT